MHKAQIYCADFREVAKKIASKSVSLVISDSPYYKIKGEFDFEMDFEEWQKLHEDAAKDFKRILKDNGTIILYGHAKNIAYIQIIFDKYFKLENSCVWQKTDCQALRSSFDNARVFTPVTERFLVYSTFNQGENDWKNNNASVYFEDYEPIRLYLRKEIAKVGVAKVANYLQVSERAIGHYLCKSQFCVPNESNYRKMQKLGILPKSWEKFSKEFESLRKEFEKHRRPFNNSEHKLTDVLKFSQETHITKNYDHPTKKPPSLTRALVQVCSNKNDLVFVPFAGSGTELRICQEEDRQAIGAETNKTYCKMIEKRLKEN